MSIKKILIAFTLLAVSSSAQKFEYHSTIGSFDEATSFYINAAGVLFVTDPGREEVISMDTLGTILNKIGGYGWSPSAFDSPVDVFADPLKVYVADKNNHRIQRFDKYLNFNFAISTRNSDIEEERFGYPLSAVMSNQGDVFILDSENSRVLKFDIFGNFILNFGGYDYGSYSLEKPKQLAVSMQNRIFIIDGKKILIFDQYGNSIGSAEGNETFTSIRIIFEWLTVTTKDKIYSANLRLPELKLTEVILSEYDLPVKTVSTLIFNNKLYLLTEKNIFVFIKAD